ncbi:MAG: N-acetyltransferase, partial [Cytophagaceae bacterium]
MEIQHKTYENHEGRFYVEKDGKRLALMTYSIQEPDTMTILHTEVDDELRGQNMG